MLRRSNGGWRWWDSNLTGGLGYVGFPASLAAKRNETLLREARESRAVAEIKRLGVVVDMGRDSNKQGVIVLNTAALLDAGDKGWDLALAHLAECLDPYSADGYVIIFRHDKAVVLPPFSWLRKALFSICRTTRKGMRKLVVQSPTPACRERLSYLEHLVSEKAAKRFERTEDWRAHVPQESSTMIRAVLQGDDVGYDAQVPGPERRRGFEAEGLLFKKSKKSLLGTSSWKKRWVRVDKEALYVYNSSYRPEVGSEPKAVIVLEGSSITTETGKRQPFGFCLKLANPQGKEIHLAGKTEEETSLWIRRMRSAVCYGKVFGVPLEEHLEATGRRGRLPAVVEHCIELLRAKALGLEGILRIGGSKKRMEEYKLAYDVLGEAELAGEADMHTVAGLLKMYLRELPEVAPPPY
jgi:hypothetical protein